MQKNISPEQILMNIGIAALNEMQIGSMAAFKSHDHIILISATGSGKTIAFLLPISTMLETGLKKTKAMVVVPSRELALQIEEVFRSMKTGMKVTSCYGGHKREIEEQNLVQPPALIIGTPGRIADHIRRGNITTDSIEVLVLDEYDKSFEFGFEDDIAFILKSINPKKKILTSATSASEIPEFIGLKDPVILNYPSDGADEEKLAVWCVRSKAEDKLESLFRLLCFLGNRSSVIFCNHREAVERVSSFLKEKGIVNEFYHGALEQKERESALNRFRNGSVNFLVTTDLASRGLDIKNIRYIIHYHLPHTEDSFTHRNGRTARQEASGTAILILGPDESLPKYITEEVKEVEPPEEYTLPEKPKWTTLFIAAGKKDKVNKVDIVGFLSKKGELKPEDIGLIEVKDFFSFVAIRKSKASHVLHSIKDHKIKNKKVKIDIAK